MRMNLEKIFEHEIGLGLQPSAAPSMEDVWGKLIYLMKNPQLTVPTIEKIEILDAPEDGSGFFSRKISFGTFEVNDVVSGLKPQSISVAIAESDLFPESCLNIEIVKRPQGRFVLRFTYYEDTGHLKSEKNPLIKGLREQAFVEKDRNLCETLASLLEE